MSENTAVVDKALKEVSDKWLYTSIEVIVEKGKYGMGGSSATNMIIKGDKGIVIGIQDINTLIVDIYPKDAFVGVKSWICDITDVKQITQAEADTYTNKKIDKYINFFKAKTKVYIDEKERLFNDIRTAQDNIYNWSAKIGDINILIKSFTSKQALMSKDKLYNVFKTIADKFSGIEFEGSGIYATTNPITMEFIDWDNNKVCIDMGVYKIKLDIITGITFDRISGGNNNDCGYIHPHIQNDGRACWGTWLKTLTELHKECNYIGELDLAYRFLCEADRHGWYIDGYAFSKDYADRCTSCWRLDCECDRCEYCGNSSDNCVCRRCPDTDDRVGEDREYCNECSYYNEDGECTY